MTRIAVNPGKVEWSGENPGIYLKNSPMDPDYSALALFFRVVFSPYGRGHAAIVLGKPDCGSGWPDAPNFIITDNQPLMKWIVDGWVTKMPTFIGKAGLTGMSWLDCKTVEKDPGNLKKRYAETLIGGELTLDLIWEDMGPPLPVEVTAGNSATKEHEMYSVFLEAKSARIVINGEPLNGEVADRPFFGRTMSTAFLAFSETWVTPKRNH